MPKTSPVDTLRRMRQAGRTKRCHTVHMAMPYDVAQHSFNTLSIILALHPEPRVELLRAAHGHDLAENWLGDLPSPAKSAHPDLRDAYEKAEADLLRRVFDLDLDGLTDEESDWLVAADMFELWLTCYDEVMTGNHWAISMKNSVLRSLRAMERLPKPISDALDQYYHRGWETLKEIG